MALNGSDTIHNDSNVISDGNESPPDPDAYLFELGTRFFIIADMIIVLVGCIGNILTFLVSIKKKMRTSPVSIFIAALAVFDTLVLVLDWMNNWLELQVNIQPLTQYEFCLFHRWFFNVTYTTSAWLVAAVSVERLIAVWAPLTSKIWCTVKNAVIAVIVIPIVISLIYIYNLWTWVPKAGSKCEVGENHSFFMNEVSPWLSAVIYSYIPLVVILFSSVAIVIRLAIAHKKRKDMTGDQSAKDDTRKVTITVLAICIAFICLTVPITVWYIYVFATQQFSNQSPRIVFIEIVILVVGLVNHSINFFLYILTSERFRNELKQMLCCSSGAKQGRRSDMQQSNSGTIDATKTSQLSVTSSNQSIVSEQTSVAPNPSSDP